MAVIELDLALVNETLAHLRASEGVLSVQQVELT